MDQIMLLEFTHFGMKVPCQCNAWQTLQGHIVSVAFICLQTYVDYVCMLPCVRMTSKDGIMHPKLSSIVGVNLRVSFTVLWRVIVVKITSGAHTTRLGRNRFSFYLAFKVPAVLAVRLLVSLLLSIPNSDVEKQQNPADWNPTVCQGSGKWSSNPDCYSGSCLPGLTKKT